MTDAYTVRELRCGDCAQAADLHVSAFPSYFLSVLGPRFLRAMYRGFASLPAGFGEVVVDQHGRLVAVAAGTVEPVGFFKALLRSEWRDTITAAILTSLRSPTKIPRLARALFFRGGVPLPVSGALLSSICVDPTVSGHGLGQQVLTAWRLAAQDRGATSAYLTTDAVDNDRVVDFYHRAGWRDVGRFTTREGRAMLCLDTDLTWTVS